MSKDSKVVEFLKGSVILVGANMILKAINFFLLPLYTHYLTPEDLGVSDTITTIAAFIFPLLVMGLDSAFSAFFYDDRSEAHSRKVFNTIGFTLLIASVVPMLVAIGSKPIAEFFFKSDEYGLLVAVALVSVSFNLWVLPFSLLVRMENRMGVFALINVIASLSMIGLNIVFVSILQWGAFSLIISSAIVQLVQLVLYLFLGKAHIGISHYDKALKNQMMKYALPLVPTVLAAWVLNLSDRYVILMFCDTSDVGLYGIASRFSSVLAVISNAVYMAYTSFAFNKKGDDNANTQYARILSAFFIVLLAICFTGGLFGKEVVELMTSPAYYISYLMLPSILYGQLAYGVNTIVGYGISFAKKTMYALWATVIGAGANLILNLIFVPIFGAVAAAYTTFFSYSLMTLASYVFSQKVYPCDYKITRIVITGLVTFAILIFTMNMSFGIKCIVWVVVASVCAYVFRDVLMDTLSLMKSIFAKFRRNKE
ncbi:MAG: oligosaccharide flippase family protein [Anaerovoracaceae bacterium]